MRHPHTVLNDPTPSSHGSQVLSVVCATEKNKAKGGWTPVLSKIEPEILLSAAMKKRL